MVTDPDASILPVLRLDHNGSIIALLGTGFIAGDRPFLITAKHVLEEGLRSNHHIGVICAPAGEERKPYTLSNFQLSPDHDIAAVPVRGLPGVQPLSISNEHVPSNQDVLTYEFSSTRFETTPTGERQITFTPFTHKGNALRHYTSTFPENKPTPSFDTSFPALQGASGAPVLRAHDFAVVGMLVANHGRNA